MLLDKEKNNEINNLKINFNSRLEELEKQAK